MMISKTHRTVGETRDPRLSRILHSPYVLDTLLAIALTLFAWLQAMTSRAFFTVAPEMFNRSVEVPFGFKEGTPLIVTFVLLALCFLPLAFRRRYPLSVLVLTVVGQIAISFLTRDPILSLIGPLIALYTVGLRVERKKLIAITAGTALLLVSAIWVSSFGPFVQGEAAGALLGNTAAEEAGIWGGGPFDMTQQGIKPPSELDDQRMSGMPGFVIDLFMVSRGANFTQGLETLALVIAAAAFGASIKSSKEYAQEVKRRAAEAARTQKEAEKRRIEEERLRIARELHDITAHSLSAVTVQAGAAETLVGGDPKRAKAAIEQIRLTSKDALEELRAIVGVLRSGDPVDDAPLAPEMGIAQIEELMEPLRASGIQVDIDLADIEALPTYASLAAYRIIQEAGTNVLRHAEGASHVRIAIHKTARNELAIEFTDDGMAIKPIDSEDETYSGHGLEGMKERAVALGGTLVARPRTREEGSGFMVEARLPLGREG